MKLVGLLKEDYVNRNRLSVGIIILAVFMTVVISVSILLLRQWNSRQVETGQREPLTGLSYCTSSEIRPCVLAFSQDPNGNMVINLLTDARSPNFYLKVRQNEREHIYQCQKVQGFSANFACTGEKMPVGEALSFVMVSTKEDMPLAEGTFPIIGLAIATPEIFVAPTFIPAYDRPPK